MDGRMNSSRFVSQVYVGNLSNIRRMLQGIGALRKAYQVIYSVEEALVQLNSPYHALLFGSASAPAAFCSPATCPGLAHLCLGAVRYLKKETWNSVCSRS